MNQKICVIIPSRNETLLCRTVYQFLEAAHQPDDIEIHVVLDGWDLFPNNRVNQTLVDRYREEIDALKQLSAGDPRIIITEYAKPQGVRVAANRVAAVTDAQYLIKLDSHCELSKEWDRELRLCYEELGPEALIIPRICGLDPVTFEWGTRFFDFLYIDQNIHQQHWPQFKFRPEGQGDVCELMSNLGASWFTSRQYWWQISLHDEVEFGTWGESAPETSLKCWLSGGKQYLNKRVQFAHVFRRRFPYQISSGMIQNNKKRTKEYWHNCEYPLQIHPIEWLIGRFWPVPGWEKGALCRTK